MVRGTIGSMSPIIIYYHSAIRKICQSHFASTRKAADQCAQSISTYIVMFPVTATNVYRLG